MRPALRLAASRGVTSIHDKDGWLGALPRFQALRREDGLATAGLAIPPGGEAGRDRRGRPRIRPWGRLPASRVHQGVHGRHARVGDRATPGRLGRGDHEPAGAGRHRPQGAPPPAFPWPCTPSAIWPTATPSTPSRRPATCGRRRDSGPRIEHAQLLTWDDVPRFASISASPPPSSSRTRPPTVTSPTASGPASQERAYAYRSLWDAGALVANGSDAPGRGARPARGASARACCERRTIAPAWHPEQALTVEQALQATTVNPAWLAGDERRRGKLVPGYLADLVVLDRDPLSCEPGRAARALGGGDDVRREMDAQPAAVGLTVHVRHVTPILNVSDVGASLAWFEQLGWTRGFTLERRRADRGGRGRRRERPRQLRLGLQRARRDLPLPRRPGCTRRRLGQLVARDGRGGRRASTSAAREHGMTSPGLRPTSPGASASSICSIRTGTRSGSARRCTRSECDARSARRGRRTSRRCWRSSATRLHRLRALFPHELYPFPTEASVSSGARRSPTRRSRCTSPRSATYPPAIVSIGGRACLSKLYVLARATRARRRLGAARLRARAASRAVGTERASLWCLEENRGARRFYERRGWTLTEETRVVPFPPNPIDVQYAK